MLLAALMQHGFRFVVVVSSNAQNHHPRASTVVVVPIGTTLHPNACLQPTPGQTGLAEPSEVCWELQGPGACARTDRQHHEPCLDFLQQRIQADGQVDRPNGSMKFVGFSAGS